MSDRSRALPRGVLAATLAASLAGCATNGSEAPVTRRDAPDARVAVPAPGPVAVPDAPALPDIVLMPGPAADTFLGRPVGDIEALIGEPALVRREGNAEFRRYDLGADCRAYVVALPGGGTVLSVDTGAAMQGAPAPRFEDCTATEGFTGS